jgi:hypothetical protein
MRTSQPTLAAAACQANCARRHFAPRHGGAGPQFSLGWASQAAAYAGASGDSELSMELRGADASDARSGKRCRHVS